MKKGKEKYTKIAKNATQKVVSTAKNNPALIKNIMIGAGGLLVMYILYKRLSSFGKGDQNIDDTVTTPQTPNASLLTISQEIANNYAQQLLDAFNAKSPLYGTDEETILRIFNQINVDDFKLIFNTFGLKDYNGHNSPPTGIWSYLDSYEKRNLVYWLKSELSPYDGEVYRKVKEIVTNAGFAF